MIKSPIFIISILFSGAAHASSVAQYFSPRPGSTVYVAESDIARLPKGSDPKRLRGFIEVTPPKSCLEVFRGEENGADMICKKTALSFRLADIDRAGRVTWSVKSSNLDQGTTLQWQTPYRLAILTPRERNNTPPPAEKPDYWRDLPIEYKLISECRDTSNQHLRQIEVSFFSGETWRFHFPDQHKLLPQPNPIPNLSIGAGKQKRGIPGGETSNKPVEEEIVADPPKQEQSAESKAEVNPKPAATPPPSTPEGNAPDNYADRMIWSVPLRNSYVMSTDNFYPDRTKPRGTRGHCRYNFQGPEDDPNTGRIECQDTPYYHMILLPLTCLHAVRGDR